MKNTGYYTKENEILTECSKLNIEQYGYFMEGFQDENDKGKFSTLQFISGCGTCLVPVFDEKGNQITFPEFAGKYYREIFIN